MNISETGFLRLSQVLKLIPISKSSWWAGIRAGRYPGSVKLGPRTTAWRVEDIRRLIEAAEYNTQQLEEDEDIEADCLFRGVTP